MDGRGKDEYRGTPLKSYQTILREEIEAGLIELHRPGSGLFLSSLSAGLEVGFSALMIAAMVTLLGPDSSQPVTRILVANMYTVGFVLVILGRSELFTEHTTLAVLPVLAGRATVASLMRVWATIFAGNLLGAACFGAVVALVGPLHGFAEPWAIERTARLVVEHDAPVIVMSGVLAGWLMGLLGWLISAGRDTIGQIVCVWIITFTIGFTELHHSIAGSVEVLAAVFLDGEIGWGEFGHFLGWASLGNTIGGVVFVAVLKYGHARRHAEDGAADAGKEGEDG